MTSVKVDSGQNEQLYLQLIVIMRLRDVGQVSYLATRAIVIAFDDYLMATRHRSSLIVDHKSYCYCY